MKLPIFIKPLTDVNVLFACDLLTTEYDEQLLEAIITVATSDIPCTCDGASAMVYHVVWDIIGKRMEFRE